VLPPIKPEFKSKIKVSFRSHSHTADTINNNLLRRNTIVISILNLLTCAGFMLHACFGYCPAHDGCASAEVAVVQHSCGCCHSDCKSTGDCDSKQHEHESPQQPCDHSGCSLETAVNFQRIQDNCLVPAILHAIAEVPTVEIAQPIRFHVITNRLFQTDSESRIARCLWLI